MGARDSEVGELGSLIVTGFSSQDRVLASLILSWDSPEGRQVDDEAGWGYKGQTA